MSSTFRYPVVSCDGAPVRVVWILVLAVLGTFPVANGFACPAPCLCNAMVLNPLTRLSRGGPAPNRSGQPSERAAQSEALLRPPRPRGLSALKPSSVSVIVAEEHSESSGRSFGHRGMALGRDLENRGVVSTGEASAIVS